MSDWKTGQLVTEVKQTCYAVPSAWDVKTADNRIYRIKYRHASLTVWEYIIGDVPKMVQAHVYHRGFSDCHPYDGLMKTWTMMELLDFKLATGGSVIIMQDPNAGLDWSSFLGEEF